MHLALFQRMLVTIIKEFYMAEGSVTLLARAEVVIEWCLYAACLSSGSNCDMSFDTLARGEKRLSSGFRQSAGGL